ncbi:ATP-binding protein [Desulforhopalus vacuolatus]|uniref:ATP-binding protein n=1 Tax=Desulforhopalus vacuolatus TaxID=40414 RepID=UPI00196623A0|nr:ATP-binding protein [Desulforhopalus vacuolatus]MBM9518513.1 ATP-binding protein [Desulforhopalus vacuolatus]
MVAPFQDEVDTSNYFPGAEFEKILSGVDGVIIGDASLMILTGPEGTGKTMLCRILCEQDDFDSVYFPHTVETFGEVVATIAVDLGISDEVEAIDGDPDDTIGRIAEALKKSDRPALVVFDEAENIYLATLERIRKMIDIFRREGCRVHILFAGRPVFIENYEQLNIVDFEEIPESFYTLNLLSEDEAKAYVFSTVEKKIDPLDVARNAFSLEKVEQICSAARGCLRAVNRLSRAAMKNPGDDSSFMTLIDEVEEENSKGGFGEPGFAEMLRRMGSKLFRSAGGWMKEHWQPVLLGVLIPGLCLSAWMFFSGSNEQESVPDVIQNESGESDFQSGSAAEEEFKKAERDALQAAMTGEEPERPEAITASRVKVSHERETGEKIAAATETEAADDGSGEGKMEKLDDVGLSLSGVSRPEEIVKISPLYRKKKYNVLRPNEILAQVVKKAKTAPALSSRATKEKVVILHPTGREKRRSANFATETTEVLSPLSLENVSASPGEIRVERLLQNRLVAGMGWKNGAKDRMYTVQLMILTSQVAVNNLKRMLAEEQYRYLASNLYLFIRGNNPGRLMVFYGEYRTMKEATRALKGLPPFLRNYHPWALSIKNAMVKVRR